MTRDDLFSRPQQPVPPFEFNEAVVQVFDDMIHRSVPCYQELICRQAQLAAHFHQPGTVIYDLGCSTGNLLRALHAAMAGRAFHLVGVDNSAAMLGVCRERLPACDPHQQIELLEADIREIDFSPASVFILNLTLQFIPPQDRDGLLRRISQALRPGGVLLLTEKVRHEDPRLDALQQDFYVAFKEENGYSALEISQKRAALEKVLVPETVPTHQQRLRQAGFSGIDIWLKWFNFAAFIGLR